MHDATGYRVRSPETVRELLITWEPDRPELPLAVWANFYMQCTVVRDENHRPVARRFMGDDVQKDPFPDLGRGDPG